LEWKITPHQTLAYTLIIAYTDPIRFPPKKWRINKVKENWKGELYYGPEFTYGTHGEHVRQVWSKPVGSLHDDGTADEQYYQGEDRWHSMYGERRYIIHHVPGGYTRFQRNLRGKISGQVGRGKHYRKNKFKPDYKPLGQKGKWHYR